MLHRRELTVDTVSKDYASHPFSKGDASASEPHETFRPGLLDQHGHCEKKCLAAGLLAARLRCIPGVYARVRCH